MLAFRGVEGFGCVQERFVRVQEGFVGGLSCLGRARGQKSARNDWAGAALGRLGVRNRLAKLPGQGWGSEIASLSCLGRAGDQKSVRNQSEIGWLNCPGQAGVRNRVAELPWASWGSEINQKSLR